jgi:cytochrome d ubiquinol oxidase subunit I
MLTELGRQPWTIYGYLKTADALTTNSNVIRLGFIFPTFFVALLILTIIVLRRTMNHKEIGRENA